MFRLEGVQLEFTNVLKNNEYSLFFNKQLKTDETMQHCHAAFPDKLLQITVEKNVRREKNYFDRK